MSQDAFDELLKKGKPGQEEHPNAVWLKRLLSDGFEVRNATFARFTDGLRWEPPVYMFRLERGEETKHEKMDWHPDLERVLFEHKIRVETHDQEASRGGHLLLQNLTWSDKTWGKDYTNHVLHEWLSARSALFADSPAFQKVLAQVPAYAPHRSQQYLDCRNYLDNCLSGYANSLVVELNYSGDEARKIFNVAVFQMFNERHHLTALSILFPK